MDWVIFLWVFGIGQLYLSYKYFFKVTSPPTVPLLCYFAMDSSWPDNGTLHPAMNATLCTHMIFISSGTQDCNIWPYDPDDPRKYFSKIPILRQQNPQLIIMLSNDGGGSDGFSQVLGSATNTTKYVKSAVEFLKKYDFDGLDIDWEFPGWNGLPIEQRKNYTMMLQELRQEFDKEATSGGKKYLLSAAVAAGRAVMEIYRDHTSTMAEVLDFINLMGYDYHSYAFYDPVTGHNSPLNPNDWWKQIIIRSGNIGWSSYEWLKRGMPKSKIMVGIPTYTHTWTLELPEDYHGVNAPAKGPGSGCDECTYAWMCEFLQSGATDVFDEDAAVPYAYKGDQWVSYDNVKSIQLKTEWILQNGFGGIMVYALNNDDVMGNSCGQGKFPLLNTIRAAMRNYTAVSL